jgi:hypothetical protein
MAFVSAMHVAVIAPGLLALSLLNGPPPEWARWCLRLVALYAVVKHAPRLLKRPVTRPGP